MEEKTIREVIEAFKHFMEDKTGKTSASMLYPPKLIYYFLKINRNRIVYNERFLKAKGLAYSDTELVLPCVELIKTDVVECPCAPASGCEFFKSKYPLPRMVNGLPSSVTLLKTSSDAVNFGIFDYVDWASFEYKINGRVKAQAKQPYFTMKNLQFENHLYVYGNVEKYSDLRAVTVAANFNDPIHVANFPMCDEPRKPLCNPLDTRFVIEEELEQQVFEETLVSLSKYKQFATGIDLLNNERNDTVIK